LFLLKISYIVIVKSTPLIDWLYEFWAKCDRAEGRRITQQELADRLHSTRSYISLLLTGKKDNPSLPVITTWFALTGDYRLFEITGFSPPPQLDPLEWFNRCSPEEKVKIASAMVAWKSEMDAAGMDITSPDALTRLSELLDGE